MRETGDFRRHEPVPRENGRFSVSAGAFHVYTIQLSPIPIRQALI